MAHPGKVQALLEWFNIIQLGDPIESLGELRDGHLFATVIDKIDPDNAVCKVDKQNVPALFSEICNFLEGVLKTKVSEKVNINAIVSRGDLFEITKLSYLILVASFSCEDNTVFVLPAASLSAEFQHEIRDLIEPVFAPGRPDSLALDQEDWTAFLSRPLDRSCFEQAIPMASSTPSQGPGQINARRGSLANTSGMATALSFRAQDGDDTPKTHQSFNNSILSRFASPQLPTSSPMSPVQQMVQSPQMVSKILLIQREQKMRKLERDLNMERHLRSELEQDLKDKEAQVEDLKTQLHNSQTHLQRSQRLQDDQDYTSELEASNDKLKQDVARYRQRIHELEDLKKQVHAQEKELAGVYKEKGALKEQLAGFEAQKKENIELRTKCHRQELRLTEIEESLERKDSQIQTLCSERDLATEEVHRARQMLREKVSEMEEKWAAMKEEAACGESMAVVTQQQELEKQISQLAAERDNLQAELSKKMMEMKAQAEELQGRESRLQSKFDSLQQELCQKTALLNDEVTSREKVIADKDIQLQESLSKLEQLKAQLTRAEGREAELTSQLEALRTQLSTREAQLSSDLSHQVEQNKELYNQREELRSQVAQLEESIIGVKSENEKLNIKLEASSNKLRLEHEVTARLQGENEALTSQLQQKKATLKNVVVEKEKELAELLKTHEEIHAMQKTELTDLQASLEEKEKECSNLQRQKNNVEEQLRNLTEVIDQKTEEFEGHLKDILAEKAKVEACLNEQLQQVETDAQESSTQFSKEIQTWKLKVQELNTHKEQVELEYKNKLSALTAEYESVANSSQAEIVSLKEKTRMLEEELSLQRANKSNLEQELSNQLQVVRDQNEVLQRNIQELQAEKESLQKRVEQALADLESQRTESEKQLTAFKVQYDNKCAEHESSIRDFQVQYEDRAKIHQQELTSVQEALAQQKAEAAKLRDQVGELETLKKEMAKEASKHLAAAHEAAKIKIAELEGQIVETTDNYETKMSEIQTEHQLIIDNMSHKHTQLESACSKLKLELKEAVNKYEQANENYQRASEQNTNLQQSLEQSQRELCEVSEAKESVDSELLQTKSQVDHTSNVLKELKTKLSHSDAQYKSLTARLEGVLKEKESLVKENLENHVELENKMAEIQKLGQDCQFSERKLQEFQKEVSLLKEQLAAKEKLLQETRNHMKESTSSYSSQMHEKEMQYMQQVDKLSWQLQELRKSSMDAEHQLRSQYSQLEVQSQRESRELKQAKERQSQLEEELAEEREALETMRSDLEALDTEHRTELEVMGEKHEAAIQQLQHQLQQLEKSKAQEVSKALQAAASQEMESKELVESQAQEIERLAMELQGAQEELQEAQEAKEQALLHMKEEIGVAHTRYLDRTEEIHRERQAEMDQLRQERMQMQNQHHQSIEQLRESTSQVINQLKQELNSLTAQLHQQEIELSTEKSVHVGNSEKMSSLNKQVEELQSQLHSAQTTIEQKERILVNLRRQHEQALQEVRSDSQARIKQQQQQMEACKSQQATVREQLAHMTELVESYRSKEQKLQARIDELDSVMKNASESAADERQALEKQLKKEFDKEKEKYKQKIHALENEVEIIKSDYALAQDNLDAAKGSLHEVEVEKTRVERQVHELMEREQMLHGNHKREIGTASEFNQKLRKQLEEKVAEIKKLQDGADKTKAQIEEMQEEIGRLEARHEENERSSRNQQKTSTVQQQKLEQELKALRTKYEQAKEKLSENEKKRKASIEAKEEEIRRLSTLLEEERSHFSKESERMKGLEGEARSHASKVREAEMMHKKLQSQVRSLTVQLEHAQMQLRGKNSVVCDSKSTSTSSLPGADFKVPTAEPAHKHSHDESFEKPEHYELRSRSRSNSASRPLQLADLETTSATSHVHTVEKGISRLSLAGGKNITTPFKSPTLYSASLARSTRSRRQQSTLDTSLSSMASSEHGGRLSLVPNGIGGLFSSEDEPDEFEWNRLKELKRRNTLCLPHLKSSYPVETQRCPKQSLTDDQLKEGTPTEQQRSLRSRKRLSTNSLNTSGELKSAGKRKPLHSYSKPGEGSTPGVKTAMDVIGASPPLPSPTRRSPRNKGGTPSSITKRRRGRGSGTPSKKAKKDENKVVKESTAFSIGFTPKKSFRRLSRLITKKTEKDTQKKKKPLATSNRPK